MDIIILKLTKNFEEAEKLKFEKAEKEDNTIINKNYEFNFKNLFKLNTINKKTITTNQLQMHNKAQFKQILHYQQQHQQQQQQPVTTTTLTRKTNDFINHIWDFCSITCIPPALTPTSTKTTNSKEKCHKKTNNCQNSIKIVLKTTNNNKRNDNCYWHTPYRLICGKSSIFSSTFSTSISFPSISFLLVLSSCCMLTTTTTAAAAAAKTTTTTTTTMSTITTNVTTLPTVYASNNNYNNNNNNQNTQNWHTITNFSNVDQHRLLKREAANSPTDLDDSNYDEEFDEYDALIRNKSGEFSI